MSGLAGSQGATVLKFRKGTTVEHESFTGQEREISIDTDLWSLVVHDGVTPGGHVVGRQERLLAEAAQAAAEAARDSAVEKTVCLAVCDFATNLVAGTGTAGYAISSSLAGMGLSSVMVAAYAAGSDAVVNIKKSRAGTVTDMLSTPVSLGTAHHASNGVIDPGMKDVAEGDIVFVDVVSVGVTPPKGVSVSLIFGAGV